MRLMMRVMIRVTSRHPATSQRILAILLAALVLLAPSFAGAADESDLDSLDADLLRQIEETRRTERELEAARDAEKQAERAAEAEAEAQAEAERAREERAAARKVKSKLNEELAIQSELMRAQRSGGSVRYDGGDVQAVEGEAFSLESRELRIASPSPELRPLPKEIFESKKVEIAKGTWGNRRALSVDKLTLDADGDGHPELIRYVDRETGVLVRQEEDRNYDGLLDAWTDFENGEPIARALDSNDDGNPDRFERYAKGLTTAREVDRDDDGVRDVFFRYDGKDLVEERHDADNDGQIDLKVTYQKRLRVRAEEDADKDGRMDTWTIFAPDGSSERVARIERDKQGRGYADTFETFEASGGKPQLARREEDRDGDGEIDMISFFEAGRLRRIEIQNPDVVPL